MAILERGFKAWAERTARSLRGELELREDEALDLAALAQVLGVRLITPLEVSGISKQTLGALLDEDPSGWSAVSVTSSERALVIFNPRHSKARQASDIAHELAHFVLNHEPSKLVVSPDGQIVMRSYNSKQEEEANWLAWSLLLPREALLEARRRKMSTAEIARMYQVSEALVTFRMGVTGIRILEARGRLKFSGPR